eukprot:Gregarina_sp_Pseudo_9__5965@NODE_972_length_2015_cov_5_782389_g911_i0_p1_GENE_NODE_972_length_2015_cov_5_782389_g911_i0NODE_972_length_2015_cov_5_782389_g911_i0_p1_ORF_typecomplete_len641_score103_70PP2C/PF00481_21/3_6e09PP2C/PF00481_21/3e54PP2C_2/PF13672_6/6_4PP2C_2/PF13672_6/1_3e13SpoIIE/PF07228_12/1_8e07DUF1258/PF06869_12/0_26_NODE_972_length_2015_cov_5_782389_g911_i01061923
MQGWRLSMEDSHVIHHQFGPPTPKQWPMRDAKETLPDSAAQEARRIHLFGIFDGHGGPKIAQFAAKALIAELENSPQFAEGNFEIAFKVAYCNIDRILRSQHWLTQLEEAESSPLADDASKAARRLLCGSQSCAACSCPQPAAAGETFADANSDLDCASPNPLSAYATTNESRSPPLVTPPAKLDQVDFCGPAHAEPADGCPQPISLEASLPECPQGEANESSPELSEETASPLARSRGRAGVAPSGGLTHGLRNALASLYKLGTGWWGGTGSAAKPSADLENSLARNGVLRATNPAMFSGCTAICALLVDNTLYIANAGDSRAVLCRAGRAETLSQDHKPTLPDERQRIYAAGGYVEFGRVNGNLNLSRALGDLIYKQDLTLPPEKQIVSGFPDVRKFELHPEDEFIVMGCDGIWEYYTSQDVVDFIRARFRRRGLKHLLPASSSSSSIDFAPRPAGSRPSKPSILDITGSLSRRVSQFTVPGRLDLPLVKSPLEQPKKPVIDLAETVEELFDLLISPNPALFEYGCDNMTAILIDLRPGAICDCQCHQSQRRVFHNIFPDTMPVDDSSNETAVPSSVDRSINTDKHVEPPHTPTSETPAATEE